MERVIPLLIVLTLIGCATPSLVTGPGPLVPLVVGTEQHVSLEWEPEGSDRSVVVRGYIRNQSPYTYDRIRVLVEALGPDGEILGQRVVWSLGFLGGWGHNYFEAAMGPADHYRARIFSWDRRDKRSGRATPETAPVPVRCSASRLPTVIVAAGTGRD